MSVRQTRLAGYTWTPEQKADYEEIYQGWDASDMAAEIVNREILHQSSLAEREQRIADAERIMLLHRDGKHGEAQIAYMNYCGKWLGEPSRG